MRIVHLVNHCVHGGNVIVPVDLACQQARDGHAVVYASAGGRYEELLECCGVRHLHLPQSLRNPVTAARSIKSLHSFCGKFQPTLLHAHMMSGAVAGYVTSRMLGVPLVTTVHNSFDRHSRLMRLGDQVVAVSEAEQHRLLAQGYGAERLHVVYNGTIGSPRDELQSSDHNIAIERPCIATVCGLEKRKAVDDLIEAFHLIAERAPSWHLYVVGDGPERAALEKLAKDAGLTSRIHFLGYVDNPKAIFDSADIFALASHAEPFGLSIAEARHAGCAVVCTNVGGIPELLEFGEAGALVEPGNPAAMAAKLGALMTDPLALAAARQSAKRNSQRFNVGRVASDYMRIYEIAVRQRRGGTSEAIGDRLAPSTDRASDDQAPIDSSRRRLRLAVGIATLGRPAVLAQTLERLKMQSRAPDYVVVCAPDSSDFQGAAQAYPGLTALKGPRGLACQRNAILRDVQAYDVLVFFDDDFVASPDYLQNVEAIMFDNSDVVMTTGRLIEDGILGPGLTFDAADLLVAKTELGSAPRSEIIDVYNGYGCNMSVRIAPLVTHHVAFDERLALYGWLEDVDFSRQLARFGRVVVAEATRGVHLGVKQGRQPGRKLGYSQVANPLYLIGKGTMSPGRALTLMARNLTANAVRSLRSESWVDRRGRLSGNIRAMLDLVVGRLDPSRIQLM
jgi:glycosyltransferase involved in cell wall biosynthesis/GT2 family glycosyltransferase